MSDTIGTGRAGVAQFVPTESEKRESAVVTKAPPNIRHFCSSPLTMITLSAPLGLRSILTAGALSEGSKISGMGNSSELITATSLQRDGIPLLLQSPRLLLL